MANQIIGKVLIVGQTENIQYQDKTFTKRELVLDCSHFDRYTGQQFENYVSLQFTGNRVSELDNFKAGELVQVSFFLSGRKSEKDGKVKYFTNIVGLKIEPYGANNVQQPQQMQQPYQQPYQQQGTQQNVSNAPQNAQGYAPIPPTVDENGNPVDDLPF